MSSRKYVLDTNVALYLLGGHLLNDLPIGEFYLSVISEIEMLSYPDLDQEEEQRIKQFLSVVIVVDLGHDLKNAVISLRKKHRLKLPDAIICATSLIYDATLLSNDAKLARITEVCLENVQLRERDP